MDWKMHVNDSSLRNVLRFLEEKMLCLAKDISILRLRSTNVRSTLGDIHSIECSGIRMTQTLDFFLTPYKNLQPKVIHFPSLGYVHTKPDKFETTFFLWIGVLSAVKQCFWWRKTEIFLQWNELNQGHPTFFFNQSQDKFRTKGSVFFFNQQINCWSYQVCWLKNDDCFVLNWSCNWLKKTLGGPSWVPCTVKTLCKVD